jgi:hemerythrin-like metal-binding protein
MPILWRNEMSVGNDLIDQDHRYLLCLFNSIELILSDKGLRDQLPFYFDQLLEYTQFHFDREEKIQLKSEYAGFYEHKQKHQQIIQRLEEVNEELKKGEKEVEEDLVGLVREWIVDHLIQTDKEMTSHLRKFPHSYQ